MATNNALFINWYTDSNGNKISILKTNEQQKVVNNKIVLTEIPDETYRVQITGFNEVVYGNIVNSNDFKVNYDLGEITFEESQEGITITVNQYYSKGAIYYPASRIYYQLDNDGNIESTLQDLADSINSYQYKGVYDNSTSYIINNIVFYNGTTYICTQNSTGNLPINETYWRKMSQGFNNKGNYSGSTQYYVGDTVYYSTENTLYVCIQNSINNLPTNTSYWMSMISVKQQITDINTAITNANTATTNASNATSLANTATLNANTATLNANTATTNANNAATNANNVVNSFVYIGVYNGSTAYVPRNLVSYNNTLYICKTATTGNLPTNVTYWAEAGKGLKWKDVYNNATSYLIYDVVNYNGSTYICISDSTGNLPTNTTYWSQMTSKGDKGDKGDALTFRGNYSGSTSYIINDTVVYNNSLYVCILASTGNVPTNTTYWTNAGKGLIWKDAYNNSTAYSIYDVVTYNGSTYLCILASTGNLPTNTTYWSQMTQGLHYTGSYSGATQYYVGDMVYYSTDSTIYLCIQKPTVGTLPTNTTYWTAMISVVTAENNAIAYTNKTIEKVIMGNTLTDNSISNYANKIAGSLIENSNIFKYSTSTSILIPSSGGWIESSQASYDKIKVLDNDVIPITTVANGGYAQRLFSFDLIKHIENNYGTIPVSTTADKITWLKTNLSKLTINWYGYGSSPTGNKATLSVWRTDTSTWDYSQNNTSSVVTKISFSLSIFTTRIDNNGYVHFLAYSDASDGVTASINSTDYVELLVELTTKIWNNIPSNSITDNNIGNRIVDQNTATSFSNTAQLTQLLSWYAKQIDAVIGKTNWYDTPTTNIEAIPKILEKVIMGNNFVDSNTTNYVGKIAGSTVENPHIYKIVSTSSLQSPSSVIWSEPAQSSIDKIKVLDNTTNNSGTTTNTHLVQHLFSFDLIKNIENTYGIIIGNTTADKASWLKSNISKLTCNWYGYGISATGNKATLAWWNGSAWASSASHTNSTVTAISRNISTSLNVAIDSNGFVHFIAYADASDGVTQSVISTDYIELQVELTTNIWNNTSLTIQNKLRWGAL